MSERFSADSVIQKRRTPHPPVRASGSTRREHERSPRPRPTPPDDPTDPPRANDPGLPVNRRRADETRRASRRERALRRALAPVVRPVNFDRVSIAHRCHLSVSRQSGPDASHSGPRIGDLMLAFLQKYRCARPRLSHYWKIGPSFEAERVYNGVRELAPAFESGSKLPHSKASGGQSGRHRSR